MSIWWFDRNARSKRRNHAIHATRKIYCSTKTSITAKRRGNFVIILFYLSFFFFISCSAFFSLSFLLSLARSIVRLLEFSLPLCRPCIVPRFPSISRWCEQEKEWERMQTMCKKEYGMEKMR